MPKIALNLAFPCLIIASAERSGTPKTDAIWAGVIDLRRCIVKMMRSSSGSEARTCARVCICLPMELLYFVGVTSQRLNDGLAWPKIVSRLYINLGLEAGRLPAEPKSLQTNQIELCVGQSR